MVITENVKKLYTEAKRFDSFLCLTAIIFAFLGSEKTAFPKHQNFFTSCFQSLAEAFLKAFLAQVMSFLTWKALMYSEEVSTQRKSVVLICLAVIHMLWIYLTNLCFTCMLTKLETIITLLEFLALIMISFNIIRVAFKVMNKIWNHLTGKTTHPTFDEHSQPNDQELLQWNPNNRSKSMKKRTATPKRSIASSASLQKNPRISSKTGIPYCQHRSSLMNHPATTFTDKKIDSPRTESNVST
ncbi:uncharacterized protein NPIL_202691 [Nephila pilipes]|uniref:Uncharacterized protein n=1 Tax=Nephila pilipes TaxID=299642 RepID=A0A8X6UMR9_NEPPI|nr:uncharacterized protein NPIL_202691 [Nephila pilipes]